MAQTGAPGGATVSNTGVSRPARRFADQERAQLRDARAGQRGVAQGLGIAQPQASRHMQLAFFATGRVAPRHDGAGMDESQDLVAWQFVQRRRHAVTRRRPATRR